MILTLSRLLIAAALVSALIPSTAAASAPASCSKTYSRATFHKVARQVYRSPTRVSAFEAKTLSRVIRCQTGGARSRKIVRRHLGRYRRTHARRFFWEFRWADVQPWIKAKLARIAGCESGGSSTAISPGGKYRGRYQFDYGTWASVGGHGDPAAASGREQDVRAAALYGIRGPAPWPHCGYV